MRRLLLTCLSLLIVIANVSFAQAKPLNIPVVYYKLPNGLKVVISEDHMAPVVTVAVYYNVGFRLEPKGRTGFAHLFEHMMFQGSANVKKFEHAKFVEANGGSLNGHTDFDYTNYYQTLPSNRVEMALWLESDRMRSLDVSQENLKNQQAVVSEEVRVNVLNQPYQFFEWISLWENAFTNWHNSHNGYGELAEINAATIEDVRSFFKTYYAPNNAVVTVVGDVDVNEVKKMIEKHFAGIPSQPMPARADLSEPPQTKGKTSFANRQARKVARARNWLPSAAAELSGFPSDGATGPNPSGRRQFALVSASGEGKGIDTRSHRWTQLLRK